MDRPHRGPFQIPGRRPEAPLSEDLQRFRCPLLNPPVPCLHSLSRTKGTQTVTKTLKIEQNNLAQLRQEYVDRKITVVPGMAAFARMKPHSRYPKLADPKEIESHHLYHIIELINSKAQLTDSHYVGTFRVTSGYCCPKRGPANNRHGKNSQHFYGKAIDFDAGSPGQLNSEKNWMMLQAGIRAGAKWWYLADQNGSRIRLETYPKPPDYPPGVTEYSRGHVDWR